MTNIQGVGVYEQDADRLFEKGSSPPLLITALIYAAAGLAVFPLNPRTKKPATRRGFYDATTNPETIRRFWRVTDRNIGIATGAMSGIWILDIDPGGEDHLGRLEAEHGKLPPTREVITGSGGRHLWFEYTEPTQCSAGRVAPHIDVRGDLGYCVSPPSIHENGRRYEWVTDPAAPVAVAPEWLLALTRKKPPISERGRKQPPIPSFHGAYAATALDAEVAALAAAVPGTRNVALNRASFVLFQLVAGGELDAELVEERLVQACHVNGLVADDGLPSVKKTVASGAQAGIRHPRGRSGRFS
jgi:Bifunctional DNA primase/polymerase, N-terminal